MTKAKKTREILLAVITLTAIYHASKSIYCSVEKQFFLHKQSLALQQGQVQAQEINKELREGLKNYRSSSGIEKLARERLNLAGPDEVIVRIGK